MDDISSWIWVRVPLAAICIAPVRMWFKLKERQLEAQTSLTAEKAAQYAAHTERLEQRVPVLEQLATDSGVDTARLREEVLQLKQRIQVLERIAVDKENSIAREIEQLRDR